MNVIFGSAGFAKEVDWYLIESYLLQQKHYATDYFVGRDFVGEVINGVPVIADESFFKWAPDKPEITVYVAVGSPVIRKKIVEQLKGFPNIHFPVFIDPKLDYDKRPGKVSVDEGSIICPRIYLTTDTHIGKFTHINLGSTIGHDTQIGDFCTISPGCNISGNVIIGNNVFIGTNATLVEKIQIPDGTIIGAGCVVTKSITEPGTYVGIPAKKIK
jgi:sugar O-acyltransferase (sialic acid O-acetyltransferase NeuD family)